MSLPKLLELAMQLAAAEEAARLSKQKENKQTKAIPRLYTYIGLKLPAVIYSDSGDGIIEEISIISPTKEYRIEITVSKYRVLYHTWEELSSISQYVNWLAAIEDNGSYNLTLYNIRYSDGVTVNLAPTKPGSYIVNNVIVKALSYT